MPRHSIRITTAGSRQYGAGRVSCRRRALVVPLLALLALLVGGPAALRAQAPAPPATLDQILKEIATYDGGIESAAVWKLRDYVYARKDEAAGRAECEGKLLQFLKTTAAPPAKMAVARHLRVIAGDTAVPALQALLKDERTADYALFVLQQLPGAPADKALLQALGVPSVATKTAIVGVLGRRRTADAVPAIVPLLRQPALAVPAATALGRIGTEPAAQALQSAYPASPAALKPVLAAALLECGEGWVKENRQAAALELYKALSSDASLPEPIRKGAALGRINASASQAPSVLLAMLNGSDAVQQEAAVARVQEVLPPSGIAPAVGALPRLPEPLQLQLLAVLSNYPREQVLPAVLQAARSDALPVRLAALTALQAVGDATVVSFAAEKAAKTRGPEQSAARATLGMLKGRAVDEAILAQLGSAQDEAVRGELLLAVGDRRIFSGKSAVTAALASPSPALRVQALKALRAIGTPSDLSPVVGLLLKSEDGSEEAEAEATASALAMKTLKAEGRAAPIRARLAEEKNPAIRARLIGVLSLIGDNSTLPLVRVAVKDENQEVVDAAVRALTAWPSSTALDDVRRVARESKNETHKLLAIAALVRLVSLDRYRAPEAAVADLKAAAGLAWRPEEQRLVLGALAQFPCADALELANGFAREPGLKAEAEAAVERIKTAMKARSQG